MCTRMGTSAYNYKDGDQCVLEWEPVCTKMGTSVYKDGNQCVLEWEPVCTRMGPVYITMLTSV